MSGFPRWIRIAPHADMPTGPTPKLSSLLADSPSQQKPTKVGSGAGDSKPPRVLPEPRGST